MYMQKRARLPPHGMRTRPFLPSEPLLEESNKTLASRGGRPKQQRGPHAPRKARLLYRASWETRNESTDPSEGVIASDTRHCGQSRQKSQVLPRYLYLGRQTASRLKRRMRMNIILTGARKTGLKRRSIWLGGLHVGMSLTSFIHPHLLPAHRCRLLCTSVKRPVNQPLLPKTGRSPERKKRKKMERGCCCTVVLPELR